eukprot:09467_1
MSIRYMNPPASAMKNAMMSSGRVCRSSAAQTPTIPAGFESAPRDAPKSAAPIGRPAESSIFFSSSVKLSGIEGMHLYITSDVGVGYQQSVTLAVGRKQLSSLPLPLTTAPLARSNILVPAFCCSGVSPVSQFPPGHRNTPLLTA